MTIEQVARYANVSDKTIRRAIECGLLRHARLGEHEAIRFRREWVDEWIEVRASGGPGREPPAAEQPRVDRKKGSRRIDALAYPDLQAPTRALNHLKGG